jgi:hypothetical protein
MTCIVGIAEAGKVYIGGDSAGVAGLDLSVRADAKVFTNGEFAFGFTSSFRMGQLIRYAFKPPKRHADQDVMEYMVTEFIGALRACLKDGGFATTKDGAEYAGAFLVGYQGRLFVVDCDYQVGEAAVGFDAVGCGAQVALGAMHVSAGKPARDRVTGALQAAEAFSAGVRGPFLTVEAG